jgi:hypothetical protein
MATTINSGVVTTKDPLAVDLAVSMASKVANLDADTSQFTTMLMQLPVSEAKSFKEEWEEDVYLPTNTALSATAAAADTVLNVTTSEGYYGKPGDVIKIVQTGEACLITTAYASAWSVTRCIGSVTAATAASGTVNGGIIIVSGSNAQGGTLPTAMVTQKTANYNYMQIQRNAYEFAETAVWQHWYSGNPLAYHRQKVAIEHKRQIENNNFLGARYYSATGPRSTAGGLDDFVTTNVTTSPTAALDKGTWNDFLRAGLQYGDPTRKVLFVAPLVAQVLSEFLADNWVKTTADQTVWGVKVDAIVDGIHGAKIPVFVKNDWMRYGEGTGKQLGSRAYLVDMTNVELKKAPPGNKGSRWMTLYPKREANDADATAEEYLSEYTLLVKCEKSHSILTGVSG